MHTIFKSSGVIFDLFFSVKLKVSVKYQNEL